MAVTITLTTSFTLDGSYIISMTEYSKDELIVKIPESLSVADPVYFNWIGPNNTKYGARVMYTDAENSDATYDAYKGNIYLAMTAGLAPQQDTGIAMFSFYTGDLYSPVVRVTVNKSILPDVVDLPEGEYETLTAKLAELEGRIETLEGE